MSGAVFPPGSLTYDRDNDDLLQKVLCQDCCIQYPDPTAGHASVEDWTLGQVWLVGLLLLSPGSWQAQGFVCAFQKSVSPVVWKFCNQIPLASRVLIRWGFSVPLQDPHIGKSVVDPRTFTTVQELLWYNCSPVCGLSAQWLCDGAYTPYLHWKNWCWS